MEITRKQLVKTAKEMNSVMGLEDPALDTSLSDEKLKAQIIKAIELINPEEDEFTEPTQEVIDALISEGEDEDEKPEGKKEDEDDDDEDEDEKPEEVELPQLVANTRKLSALKELANERDEFKKLRKGLDAFQGLAGPKELQAAMFKALGVEPPKPAPKKEKKEKSTKVTAMRAVVLAFADLGANAGKEAILKRAVEIGAENGVKFVSSSGSTISIRYGAVLEALSVGMSLPAKK